MPPTMTIATSAAIIAGANKVSSPNIGWHAVYMP
jgi:hypothetical protein